MDIRVAMQRHREELVRQREELISQVMQLQANVNAYNGALEECDYWLAQLSQEAESPVQPVQE